MTESSPIDVEKARSYAVKTVRKLSKAGFIAYFAGGCVRDQQMRPKQDPHDFDIATNALPDQIQEVFADKKTLAIGAAFGAFYLGASTESMRMNIKLLVSFLFCGLFTVAYSQSGVFLVSVVLLAGFGLAEGMFTILVVLLLQQNVPSQMRGRVMGAWTFCIGVGPIGAMSIGYLAESIGVQYAVGISGALLVLATSIITVTVPRLRKE